MKKAINQSKGKQYEISIPTRFGLFFLEATKRGLYQLEFPGRRESAKGKQARGKAGNRDFKKEAAVHNLLLRAGRQLHYYLEGRPASFRSLRLDYSGFTPFECKVLRGLRRVPMGRVVSYSHLARKVGVAKAGRAVGSVMRNNRLPIFIPCHRVIRADGLIGHYSKGTVWKRQLLLLEGVSSSGLSGARR